MFWKDELRDWLNSIKSDLEEVVDREVVKSKRLKLELNDVEVEVEVREGVDYGIEYELLIDVNARDANHYAAKWVEFSSSFVQGREDRGIAPHNEGEFHMCEYREEVDPADIREF